MKEKYDVEKTARIHLVVKHTNHHCYYRGSLESIVFAH